MKTRPADEHPPPPDLHALVAAFGSYSAIPSTAWAAFDRDVERYNHRMRLGHFWRNDPA